MNWAEFVRNLLEVDLRLSSLEVQNLTGIKQPVIDRWKNGQVEKPQRNTLRRLEQALKIKIDDRNPDNITYTKIPDFGDIIIPNRYPVLSEIKAGITVDMLREHIGEYVSFPYEKIERCFVLKIKGDSMNGTVSEGDYVLVDMDAEIVNGNIVAVLLKSGHKMIKRYKELTESVIMFYSDNPNHPPVTVEKSEIESIYRVVLKTTRV